MKIEQGWKNEREQGAKGENAKGAGIKDSPPNIASLYCHGLLRFLFFIILILILFCPG